MTGHRLTRRLAMLSALGMVALSACSFGAARPAGTPLDVTVGDFHITPATTVIRSGNVEFLVQDKGPSTHEFVVARTDLPPGALPLRPDGLTIDEDSPLIHIAGEIDELDIGDHGRLQLHLPPGRYVLFCNLEGHYLGGMHALVEVRNDAGRP